MKAMNRETPKLRATKDYSMFQDYEFNRDIEKTKKLRESMTKYGFIPALPCYVIRNGNGKLKIKSGHHRAAIAKELGLPIYFIICEDSASIYELESSTKMWSTKDFLTSHIRAGKNSDYLKVLKYHEETGIGLQHCLALIAGEGAGSNNHMVRFKEGTFKAGDYRHAAMVKDIVLHMKANGIDFAHQTLVVNAISKVLMLSEFDAQLFKHKISTFSAIFVKKQNLQQYLELIEEIYNFRQSKQRLPIAFLAEQNSKNRQQAFGRVDVKSKK